MNEFDFIKHYLVRSREQDGVILGIGDDAAIVRPQVGMDLHISSDMLLENRHFFSDVDPADLAHKVLAVNLSDMAAMGATPKWVLLSVALPMLDENWLKSFCDTLFSMATQYDLAIIGGDTTKGPLTFNVTIIGQAERGKALRRSGAKSGDEIWVSGKVGLAAAALQHILGKINLPKPIFDECEHARLRPTPRVALGQALLPIAHAAQDISDGLGQDLKHILNASNMGATIYLDSLPTLDSLKEDEQTCLLPLIGGDDYELIFTAPVAVRKIIEELSHELDVPLTRIGCIEKEFGLRIINKVGEMLVFNKLGFDHFDEN